ncbi:unnamed protein product [Meganyctiphanes norvegica]|uniref:Uncharacterized protein n=1 Tax=Meganyctiphanes norvegica TaxID=48144 RepID=A0AAV2PKT2_MEGNR
MKNIIILLYLTCISSSWFVSGYQNGITFVILSQQQDRHIAAAQFLAEEIEKKAKDVNFEVSVYVDGISWPARSSWVYFPLLQILSDHYLEDKGWVVFLNEWNRVNLEVLWETLSVYDSHEMIYLGRAISDIEPSILHHFDEVDRKNPQLYPDMRTAIVLSAVLVRNLADKWTNNSDLDINFSIDAPYEFTKFVNKENGPKLLKNLSFCINHGKGCSVSYHPLLKCVRKTPLTRIFLLHIFKIPDRARVLLAFVFDMRLKKIVSLFLIKHNKMYRFSKFTYIIENRLCLHVINMLNKGPSRSLICICVSDTYLMHKYNVTLYKRLTGYRDFSIPLFNEKYHDSMINYTYVSDTYLMQGRN